MTNHITLSDFPASCSCMKLTSKQGRPYWFRTCDLNTSIWDAGAHAVSFPAGGEHAHPVQSGQRHVHGL